MALVYRGEELTKDNHKLDLYTFNCNVVTDVTEAKFRIFDITDEADRTLFYDPSSTEIEWRTLQEYPAVPGNYCIIDVVNLADSDILPGQKLGTGHYFAPWEVPEDASPGSYVIVWEYRFLGDPVDVYQKSSQEFVVSEANYFIPEQTIADDVREFMRDYAFQNELVDGFESTDSQIKRAIDMTISRYNMLAPRSVVYTVDNFPVDLKYIAISGAVGHLLKSISIVQLRNQLTYTDGGVHVGLTDKHQLYRAMGAELLAEFDDMATKDKITRNLDAAWGDVHSPYHGYYTYFGG